MVGVQKPAARAGPEDQHCQYCQIQQRFDQQLVYSHSERQLLLVKLDILVVELQMQVDYVKG